MVRRLLLLTLLPAALGFGPALRAMRRAAAMASTPTPDAPVTSADVKEWMTTMDPDALEEELDLSDVPVKAMPPPDISVEENSKKDVVGDFGGTDDALEEPWRVEAAGIAKAAGEATGVVVKDVYWEPGTLRVAVTKGDGSTPDAEDCAAASRAVVEALEEHEDRLRVLARHDLEVTSPGASDLITTQAAFEAFKGFDVTVRTLNPIEGGEERIIEGRLQERTTTDVVINVKGRMVKIPWHLVGEVRLPPAKSE